MTMHAVAPVAQTNLQLYAQLESRPELAPDRARIQQAYQLVASCSSGLMRGSGKPFVCHLVGTASLLAEAGDDADGIIAGMLHATYQNRMPFPANAPLETRRKFVHDAFGPVVEDLVHQYHDFEVARIDMLSDAQLRERARVVRMRLADEAEDLLDLGVLVHGRAEDAADVPGGAESRRAQKARLAPDFLRAARAVSAPTLERRLAFWLARTHEASWPEAYRSGRYSSYSYRAEWPDHG